MNEHLDLYTVFHLNLAYSSIEEEQRAEVVARCYWPLLKLARELELPFGIEAPAYTLEAAEAVDPAWLAELRSLVTDGPCELVASGYAQVIGPLVPAEVNAANLRLGNEAYERLLGARPSIVLVNEQAYSTGLIELYLEAGFKAIVMEWDNPHAGHPEWDPEWRYLPQIACGQHGEEIPLLWNKSVAFQQFQRYVHGENDLDKYLDYLGRHVSARPRAFSLYGNDIEVFDFRPGRYHTEAVLEDGVEWRRIRVLFESLAGDSRFKMVRPSEVLDLSDKPGASNRLSLESAGDPVPVKKQGKYNLTRWAVTPRDDLAINTACWRIYERLLEHGAASDDDWRELCYLWSSDFRTHITDRRWAAYKERLAHAKERPSRTSSVPVRVSAESAADGEPVHPDPATVETRDAQVIIRNGVTEAVLSTRRGLSVERLTFSSLGPHPVVGTLPHGYYDDISLGADYYTGHLVLEPPGSPKLTDLEQVRPETSEAEGRAEVSATLETALGPLHKRIWLEAGDSALQIEYRFGWEAIPMGSLRLGHVTLVPEQFDRQDLYYASKNGGRVIERSALAGTTVDHGRPVSSLVSASAGLGLTDGVVEIGDAERKLRVEVDKAASALLGLVTYREVGETFFARLAFSVLESDETAKFGEQVSVPENVRLAVRGVSTTEALG